MQTTDTNKIAMAAGATLLLVLGLKNLGDVVFHTTIPEKDKAGFAIQVAETPAAGGKAAVAAPATPLPVLLAKADATKGLADAKACAACHDFTKGGPNKVGPNLWDVVGRPMGTAANFAYSDGFKAMGGKAWSFEDLNTWLQAPKAFIKGTKMGYAGMGKEQDRADTLAYLASLSDSPKPLPKP